MKPRKPRRAPAALSRSTAEEGLQEGDFYWERGKMVFTASFLLRRGFCCQSGCRHCPYGFGPEGLRLRLGAEKL